MNDHSDCSFLSVCPPRAGPRGREGRSTLVDTSHDSTGKGAALSTKQPGEVAAKLQSFRLESLLRRSMFVQCGCG
jgi:hypothetical protein